MAEDGEIGAEGGSDRGMSVLEKTSESVYLKLLSRFGTPLFIALLGYLVNTQLAQIREATDTLAKLSSDSVVTGVKIDQLKSDLGKVSSDIYRQTDATKDWKLQNERDNGQDQSILRLQALQESESARLRNLELGKKE